MVIDGKFILKKIIIETFNVLRIFCIYTYILWVWVSWIKEI